MELCSCLSLGAVQCVETGTTTIVHNIADLAQGVLFFCFFGRVIDSRIAPTDESAMSHSFFCLTELDCGFRAKGKLLIDGLQRFMSNLKL